MSYTGKWNVVMKTPMGDRTGLLTLAQEGEALSGSLESDGDVLELTEGSVEAGRAKWKVDLTSPMPITLEFDVVEQGGDLDGQVKLGMFGTSSVTGTPA